MPSDKKKINVNVFVTLDSVLDTRHPTVYGLHKKTGEEMLVDNKYQHRCTDRFGIIPHSVFKSFYNRRNKNILKLSLPTPMIELLASYCKEGYSALTATAISTLPTLYVNVYPYVLTDDEKGKLIVLFHNIIEVRYIVKIVYMDIDAVNPTFIHRNVTTYIDYDIISWIEYHTTNGQLSRDPLTAVSCVGPLIANGHKRTKDLTQDDFEDLMSAVAPYCALTLVQASLFSLDT